MADPRRLAFESEICSVRSDGRQAFQDWRVKSEMNRLTSSSEIGPQDGKAQWHRSEQKSVWSVGRRAFQDWCAKGEMSRLTSSSEFSYYIENPRKWKKCKLISGDRLCGQRNWLAMNWVDQPRTSADERDVVWAPCCRDCV